MSDLPERLRTAEYKLSEHQQERIFQEAADEIERLQAEAYAWEKAACLEERANKRLQAVVDAAVEVIDNHFNDGPDWAGWPAAWENLVDAVRLYREVKHE